MILQRLLRRPSGLQALEQLTKPIAKVPQRRWEHHVPALTHGNDFREHGVPGLLSPEGYELAWTQYQGMMVEKLNELTAGTRHLSQFLSDAAPSFHVLHPFAEIAWLTPILIGTPQHSATTKSLILEYARDPAQSHLFNHASMALNNHFFFSGLALHPVDMASALRDALVRDFSSIETLKLSFLATARAMFGPGFVWLVQARTDRGDAFRILSTYLAGSPYPDAHWRRQPVDMNTQSAASLGGVTARPQLGRLTEVQNTVGAYGAHSGERRNAPGGVDLVPLLCVNTWEHVWLRDWGVKGKEAFLERWWDGIDWDVVDRLWEKRATRRYDDFTR
ncbi:hypothetical protein LTR16_004115 [Cryomyces antarcticus]|uniref:Manganese/iron superoxide dismutase C-terminal domain-containing protein n=1 Tax=Cryomyces antarcticus TaxID=329879 RepID=A0ABR0LXH2_9PEZI|nr:hypothetical protein LTR16_004115 [Cryomyces antarcticus]